MTNARLEREDGSVLSVDAKPTRIDIDGGYISMPSPFVVHEGRRYGLTGTDGMEWVYKEGHGEDALARYHAVGAITETDIAYLDYNGVR